MLCFASSSFVDCVTTDPVHGLFVSFRDVHGAAGEGDRVRRGAGGAGAGAAVRGRPARHAGRRRRVRPPRRRPTLRHHTGACAVRVRRVPSHCTPLPFLSFRTTTSAFCFDVTVRAHNVHYTILHLHACRPRCLSRSRPSSSRRSTESTPTCSARRKPSSPYIQIIDRFPSSQFSLLVCSLLQELTQTCVLRCRVIVGTLVSLPVLIAYYAVLGIL
jgi:hypothetical protein